MVPPDQGERFIAAITGERKQIPGWNGQPNTFRSWLKLLALWEAETTLSRERWGLRLYQSFPENSQPRRIADQIPMGELLKPSGYSLVLNALIAKYKPYLEIEGPASVDKYFYSGERAKGESFSSFIAGKEVSKQELESNLGERLNDKVAGRVLLRQANLTEFQREMISLKDTATLMSFDEVAAMLRPLDRPEMIAQAAGASLGPSASKHYPTMSGEVRMQFYQEEEERPEAEPGPDGEECDEEEESEELEEDVMYLEDREYEEDEAIYLQAYHSAYADVRKDMRDRRRERGFIKHNKAGPTRSASSSSSPSRWGKGRNKQGKGRGRGGRQGHGPNQFRGTSEDLQSRTNCQELGHFARDCPLKGGATKGASRGQPKGQDKKVNFVMSRGQTATTVYMTMQPSSWPRIITTQNTAGGTSRIFAGITVRGFEALVDTAAEDAVIGEGALRALQQELRQHGLQSRPASTEGPHTVCAGIGGEISLLGLEDVPIAVAGVHGLLRFSVLKDGTFSTPPLLPISFLEAIGAKIDLEENKLFTADGHGTCMQRLPSGHRTVNIFDFQGHPWTLPQQFHVDGRDPFQVYITGDAPEQTHDAPEPSGALADLNHHNPSVHIWCMDPNDDLHYVTSMRGWRHGMVHPEDVGELLDVRVLDQSRVTYAVDASGHVMRIHDAWNLTDSCRPLRREWQGHVYFRRWALASSNFGSGGVSADGQDASRDGPGPGPHPSGEATPTERSSQASTGQSSNFGTEITRTSSMNTRGAVQSFPVKLKNVNDIERRARELRQQAKFGMNDMDDLLLTLKTERGGQGTYRDFYPEIPLDARPFAISFGAFIHGKYRGITRGTEMYPELCWYLASWLARNAPGHRFTSIALSHNLKTKMHRDVNNGRDSENATVAFGKFTKGRLWIEADGSEEKKGPRIKKGLANGSEVRGRMFDTYHKVIRFSPKRWHEVQAWRGSRVSLTAFSVRDFEKFEAGLKQQLRGLGFLVPEYPIALATCSHHDIAESAVSTEADKQCEHDFETVFDQMSEERVGQKSGMPNAAMMFERLRKFVLCAHRRPLRPRNDHVVARPGGQARGRGVDSPRREGACGISQKDGHAEMRGSLEASGPTSDDHPGNGPTTDGGGLHGHERGHREASAILVELLQGEGKGEEAQGRPHRPGHRQATEPIQGSQDLRQGAPRLQPPSGQTAMPSQRAVPVVDVHPVRQSMGAHVRGSEDSGRPPADIRGCGQASEQSRAGISSILASSQGTSESRGQVRGDGPLGKAPSTRQDGGEAESRDWIGLIIDDKSNDEGPQQGAQSTVGNQTYATIKDSHENNTPGGARDWGQRRRLGRHSHEGGKWQRVDPGPRLLLEPQDWQRHSDPKLRKLGTWITNRGWALKSIIVLITWAHQGWLHMYPTSLGTPTRSMFWDRGIENWRECGKQEPVDTIACHVFDKKCQRWNWAMDLQDEGSSSSARSTQTITADQRRALRKELIQLGAPSTSEKDRGTVTKAIDYNFGWDFELPEHRQAAAKQLSEQQPDVILLRAQPRLPLQQSFVMSVANLQESRGRGFILDHSRMDHPGNRDRWNLAMAKQGYFELVQERAGEPSMPLISTNIPHLIGVLERRASSSAAEWKKPECRDFWHPRHQAIFCEQFMAGLRQHLQLQNYPVFQLSDHWEKAPHYLLCRHFAPRTRLALPSECKIMDITKMKFTGRRSTHQFFLHGGNGHTEDDWTIQPPPSGPPPTPWTGTTTFWLQPQILLPATASTFVSWWTASAAHVLFSFQRDQAAFQAEWSSAFPSHRLLGEEASSASDRASRQKLSTVPEDAMETDLMEELDEIPLELPTNQATEAAEDEMRAARELRELQTPKVEETPDTPAPHPELRRELFRIHRNLGHPDNQSFCRALRHSGVKPEIIKWVRRYFKCPICQARKKPNSHRPAHLSRSMPFNEVVGVDLIYINRRPLLNMLCWGTNFQQVELLPDQTAITVSRALVSNWFAHYGPPTLLVCDQGPEFIGKDFVDLMGDYAVTVHFTDTHSPWQNSRTERAGGIFKDRLEKVCAETNVIDESDLKVAIVETVNAHNRYYDRSGYSPQQRVFGRATRIPGSLLSDDQVDRQFLCDPSTDEMKRALEIREAAGKAWMAKQDYEAVSRATRSNTRTVDAIIIRPGDRVYVWRNTARYRGWGGPGMVVQVAENGRSLWISLRGYLLKASREQVRLATNEENLGAELVKILSSEMLHDLESGNLRHFRDVQEEGTPEPDLDANESEFSMRNSNPPSLNDDVEMSQEEYRALGLQPPPELLHHQDEQSLPSEEPPEPSTREPSAPALSVPNSRRSSVIQIDEASGGRMHVRLEEAPERQTQFGPIRETSSQPPMPYPMSHSPAAWPRPAGPSHFYSVIKDPDNPAEKVRWWQDRSRDRWVPIETSKETFNLNDAEAIYNHKDRRMYLSKKKESPGQIEFRKLPEMLKKTFRKSRDKEIKSLIDSGAIKVLTLEESIAFEQENPDHVITSRYVDRWKPAGEASVLPDNFDSYEANNIHREDVAPKSRWTVIGWRDPDLHSIERSSPTPLTTTIYLAMQVSATRSWKAFIKDVKTAFLQGKPTTRKRKLAARMPDEAFPGYDPRQLILLLTEVYGLVSGPSWWRKTLLEYLVRDLGYRVNCYDKCLLTLDALADGTENPRETQGILVIEVDDILEAGGARHRQKMAKLEQKFRFGKIVDLMSVPEGTGYAGRRVVQLKDYSFQYDMQDYVQNRLKFIKMDRKVLQKHASTTLLNEDEESQLRGVLATINWTAREGRPDASAAASILAGCFPSPTVAHIHAANRVVEHLKEHKVIMRIHAIPESHVRHLVISDASFDPSGKTKPQHGWIQGLTTPGLNQGQQAPVSMIAWKSKRMKRKAGNTLLCESIAMSSAMGALEKQEAMWRSMLVSHFDPKIHAYDEDLEEQDNYLSVPTVIAEEEPKYRDPNAVAVADAKSLFDALHSEQASGEDDRSALEIAIIQDSLQRLRGRIRWVPHNFNPADGLTKLEGAHMKPLLDLCKSNSFCIQSEADVLSSGRQGEKRLKSKG